MKHPAPLYTLSIHWPKWTKGKNEGRYAERNSGSGREEFLVPDGRDLLDWASDLGAIRRWWLSLGDFGLSASVVNIEEPNGDMLRVVYNNENDITVYQYTSGSRFGKKIL